MSLPKAAARPRAKTAVRIVGKTDVVDRVLAAVAARAPDADVRQWAAEMLAKGEGARDDAAAKAG